MLPNVLLVEDSTERLKVFQSLFGQQELLSVDTAKAALELLAETRFDLVHLDCNLAGARTGRDAAQQIAETPSPPPVLIHSENIAGVMSIQEVLRDAVHVPPSMSTPPNHLA